MSKPRDASFRSIIAYCEKKGDVHLFSADVKGTISKKEQGLRWGFDPIFIPQWEKPNILSACGKKSNIS